MPAAVVPDVRALADARSTAFDRWVKIDGEVYSLHESRLANLGKQRGRVRRIAVLTLEGKQINLVASSDLPAETLLAIMIGRWLQENGFKHGNERCWGINQLDARSVVPYAPETVNLHRCSRRCSRDHAKPRRSSPISSPHTAGMLG